jgi:hypothetical protein
MHNSLDPADCVQRLRTLPGEAPPPYNWQEFQRRAATVRVATDWRPLAAAAALLLFVCAIAVWGRFGGSGRHVVADSGAVEDGVKTRGGGVESSTHGEYSPQGQASGAAAQGHWRQSQANGAAAHEDSSRQAQRSGAAAARSDELTIAGVRSGESATVSNRAAEISIADNRSGESATASNRSLEISIAANRSRAIESWMAALPSEPAVVRVGTRAAVAGLEDRIAQVDDLMTSLRIDGTPPDRVAALQQERLRLVGSLAQVRYAEVVASRSP